MPVFIRGLILLCFAMLSGVATAQEPVQCTAFDSDVMCNAQTGQWEVRLSNAAHPLFSPSQISVSTAHTGISVSTSANDPALISLSGASAGDVITLSVDAVETGAGGAPGLDLCCMGDVDIRIPEGEQCTPPPPDRALDVSKVCAPLGYEDPFGSNVECTFTVAYSGPPPTPSNPITITDALTSGGPMTVQSSWPPSGPDSLWNCTPTPATGPYTCTMDNTLDPDPGAGYWSNYTSSFTIQATMTEPYRNCLDGAVKTATGAPVTAQSCTQKGDTDLSIEKSLVAGSTCLPNQTCQFEITVSNKGNDPYIGDIALTDEVQVTGASSNGTLTAITPSVCAISDLETTGCVTPVSIGAGQSTSFVIDYLAPSTTGDSDALGQNCAGLTDETMGPTDSPETTQGHLSCTAFSLEEPRLRVEKEFLVEECSPGGACPFTITIHNDATSASYSGPVAIRDTDTPGGLQIQSVTPPVCLPAPTVTPFDCEAAVSIPAGGSQVLTFDAYMPFSASGDAAPSQLDNCVSGAPAPLGGTVAGWPADLFETQQDSCAQVMYCGFACHSSPEVTDKLTMAKELLNPEACEPGGTCRYQITISNLGNDPVTGPLTMEEHLPTGASITSVSALPWSCGPVQGGMSTCAHPPLTLNAGDTTSFTVDVAIPAGFDAAQIANCAGFHGDTSPLAAARAIEQAVPTGPAALFARKDGYSASDLAAYLQIRGLPAGVAQRKSATLRQNGAATRGSREMSCAIKVLREEAPTSARLDVEKSCDIVSAPAGAPLTLDCTVTLTGQGLSEGDAIDFSDQMTGLSDGARMLNDPWFDGTLSSQPCIHNNAVPESICALPVTADMAAGQPFEMSGQIVIEPWEFDTPMRNCATATLRSDTGVTGDACATISVPEPKDVAVPDETPDEVPPLTILRSELSVEKTMPEACSVNRGAQTYTCLFELSVSNKGNAPYSGPLSVIDTITDGAKPVRIEQSGAADLACLSGRSNGATCMSSSLEIAPNASTAVQLKMVIAGLRDGGTMTNCATFGLPEDPVQIVKLAQQAMQNAGLDVGKIDGAFGPRSRRTLKALQDQLGLPQTGEIDDTLFAALGFKAQDAAAPSCVTADLPPMPRPVVVKCTAGERKNSAGQCYTPKVRDCPAGQKMNSRGKCYVVDVPTGPTCDARTTVARGDECACRYRGMRKVSATKCACSSGLPPVRGVGCVNVTINRSTGSDGPAGHSTEGRNCVTVLGVKKCF